jgi:hypothetical protein
MQHTAGGSQQHTYHQGYSMAAGGKGKQDSKYGGASGGDKKGGMMKQHSETIGMKQGQMLRANDDLSQDKFLMGTFNKGPIGK